jgi:hypothetical protein
MKDFSLWLASEAMAELCREFGIYTRLSGPARYRLSLSRQIYCRAIYFDANQLSFPRQSQCPDVILLKLGKRTIDESYPKNRQYRGGTSKPS